MNTIFIVETRVENNQENGLIVPVVSINGEIRELKNNEFVCKKTNGFTKIGETYTPACSSQDMRSARYFETEYYISNKLLTDREL